MKKMIVILCISLFLVLASVLVLIFISSRGSEANMIPPYISSYAKVVEIESDRSLIVELVTREWWDSDSDIDDTEINEELEEFEENKKFEKKRNKTTILTSDVVEYGDIIRLEYAEDNKWISDAIENKIEIGTMIKFHYATFEKSIDLDAEPYTVSAAGLEIYGYGSGDEVDNMTVFNGAYLVFSRLDDKYLVR